MGRFGCGRITVVPTALSGKLFKNTRTVTEISIARADIWYIVGGAGSGFPSTCIFEQRHAGLSYQIHSKSLLRGVLALIITATWRAAAMLLGSTSVVRKRAEKVTSEQCRSHEHLALLFFINTQVLQCNEPKRKCGNPDYLSPPRARHNNCL